MELERSRFLKVFAGEWLKSQLQYTGINIILVGSLAARGYSDHDADILLYETKPLSANDFNKINDFIENLEYFLGWQVDSDWDMIAEGATMLLVDKGSLTPAVLLAQTKL